MPSVAISTTRMPKPMTSTNNEEREFMFLYLKTMRLSPKKTQCLQDYLCRTGALEIQRLLYFKPENSLNDCNPFRVNLLLPRSPRIKGVHWIELLNPTRWEGSCAADLSP